MGKQCKQWETVFLGSKITADGNCSHEIKIRLLLGRKAMTNLGSILKSRDITLPTNVHLVKAIVFPVVMYGCESWAIKKAEHQRIDTFELWCWRRLLRVPCTARRSNQSILKEIIPEYSLEGFPGGSEVKVSASNVGDPGSIPGFNPWVGKIPWRRKLQPTPVFLPRESYGWRSLVGYSPWGRKESDTTEWLHFHSL